MRKTLRQFISILGIVCLLDSALSMTSIASQPLFHNGLFMTQAISGAGLWMSGPERMLENAPIHDLREGVVREGPFNPSPEAIAYNQWLDEKHYIGRLYAGFLSRGLDVETIKKYRANHSGLYRGQAASVTSAANMSPTFNIGFPLLTEEQMAPAIAAIRQVLGMPEGDERLYVQWSADTHVTGFRLGCVVDPTSRTPAQLLEAMRRGVQIFHAIGPFRIHWKGVVFTGRDFIIKGYAESMQFSQWLAENQRQLIDQDPPLATSIQNGIIQISVARLLGLPDGDLSRKAKEIQALLEGHGPDGIRWLDHDFGTYRVDGNLLKLVKNERNVYMTNVTTKDVLSINQLSGYLSYDRDQILLALADIQSLLHEIQAGTQKDARLQILRPGENLHNRLSVEEALLFHVQEWLEKNPGDEKIKMEYEKARATFIGIGRPETLDATDSENPASILARAVQGVDSGYTRITVLTEEMAQAIRQLARLEGYILEVNALGGTRDVTLRNRVVGFFGDFASRYLQKQNAKVPESVRPEVETFVSLLPPDGPVVDVGTGPGTYAAAVAEKFYDQGSRRPVVGIDAAQGMLDVAGERHHELLKEYPLEFRRMAVDEILHHFPPNSQAGILDVGVLHFAPSESAEDRIFSHYFQILQEGGILFLNERAVESGIENTRRTVRSHPEYGGDPIPYNQYVLEDLIRRLEAVGFEILRDRSGYKPHSYKPDRWVYVFARKPTRSGTSQTKKQTLPSQSLLNWHLLQNARDQTLFLLSNAQTFMSRRWRSRVSPYGNIPLSLQQKQVWNRLLVRFNNKFANSLSAAHRHEADYELIEDAVRLNHPLGRIMANLLWARAAFEYGSQQSSRLSRMLNVGQLLRLTYFSWRLDKFLRQHGFALYRPFSTHLREGSPPLKTYSPHVFEIVNHQIYKVQTKRRRTLFYGQVDRIRPIEVDRRSVGVGMYDPQTRRSYLFTDENTRYARYILDYALNPQSSWAEFSILMPKARLIFQKNILNSMAHLLSPWHREALMKFDVDARVVQEVSQELARAIDLVLDPVIRPIVVDELRALLDDPMDWDRAQRFFNNNVESKQTESSDEAAYQRLLSAVEEIQALRIAAHEFWHSYDHVRGLPRIKGHGREDIPAAAVVAYIRPMARFSAIQFLMRVLMNGANPHSQGAMLAAQFLENHLNIPIQQEAETPILLEELANLIQALTISPDQTMQAFETYLAGTTVPWRQRLPIGKIQIAWMDGAA